MLRQIRTCALPIFMLAVVAATVPASAGAATTLDNLQAAYDGESNARARYEEFAKKADQDGFAGAATLFRAAAKAEGIHLTNHAVVIRQMGAEPRANVKPAVVGSTRENLDAAAKGEAYENETMYVEFLKQARTDGNKAAVRTFRFARAAEGEHLALYKIAAANLDSWKDSRTLWVCPVCGSTLTQAPSGKCDVCWTKPGKYMKVA